MDWTQVPCHANILGGQRECPKRVKYVVLWAPTGEEGQWQEGDAIATCSTHLGQAVEAHIKHTGGDMTKVAKLW